MSIVPPTLVRPAAIDVLFYVVQMRLQAIDYHLPFPELVTDPGTQNIYETTVVLAGIPLALATLARRTLQREQITPVLQGLQEAAAFADQILDNPAAVHRALPADLISFRRLRYDHPLRAARACTGRVLGDLAALLGARGDPLELDFAAAFASIPQGARAQRQLDRRLREYLAGCVTEREIVRLLALVIRGLARAETLPGVSAAALTPGTMPATLPLQLAPPTNGSADVCTSVTPPATTGAPLAGGMVDDSAAAGATPDTPTELHCLPRGEGVIRWGDLRKKTDKGNRELFRVLVQHCNQDLDEGWAFTQAGKDKPERKTISNRVSELNSTLRHLKMGWYVWRYEGLIALRPKTK